VDRDIDGRRGREAGGGRGGRREGGPCLWLCSGQREDTVEVIQMHHSVSIYRQGHAMDGFNTYVRVISPRCVLP